MKPTLTTTSLRAVAAGAALLIGMTVTLGLPRAGDAAEPRATNIVAWAVVNGSGGLLQSKNVSLAFRVTQGQYAVVFNRKIHRCSLSTNARSAPVFILARPFTNDKNAVSVWAYNHSLMFTDVAFDLQVICG